MGLLNDTSHNVSLLLDEDVLKGSILVAIHVSILQVYDLRQKDLLDKILPYLGYTPILVKLLGE